jgi:hypothetical protein
MRRPFFALTALASAQVRSRSYVQGSGALTTRGPSWSGDGVAMAACDEPATSSVAPPVGSLRRPPGSLCPMAVSAESKPVVPVSTVTRQPPQSATGHQ